MHFGAHVVGELDRVRAGRLEDRNRHRLPIVEKRAQRVFGGTELDPGDIMQAGDLAVRTGLQDDVTEFLLGDEPALGVDREREVARARLWGTADRARRDLNVLLADRPDHIGPRHSARSDLVRIEPDAHRIIPAAKDQGLADTLDASDLVLDAQGGIIAEIQGVVFLIRGEQVHHHGEIRGLLLSGDTESAYVLGQPR